MPRFVDDLFEGIGFGFNLVERIRQRRAERDDREADEAFRREQLKLQTQQAERRFALTERGQDITVRGQDLIEARNLREATAERLEDERKREDARIGAEIIASGGEAPAGGFSERQLEVIGSTASVAASVRAALPEDQQALTPEEREGAAATVIVLRNSGQEDLASILEADPTLLRRASSVFLRATQPQTAGSDLEKQLIFRALDLTLRAQQELLELDPRVDGLSADFDFNSVFEGHMRNIRQAFEGARR